MTEVQTKLIERLAEECIKNDHGHQDHIDKHKLNFFIAGATHPKVVELYRAEGKVEAFMESARTCKFYLSENAERERERLAALLGEGE